MNDELNFRKWYVEVLESLYPKRAAGIAILMISMPLLERYMRQKDGISPADPLESRCMAILRMMFPVLVDEKIARDFWDVFRNGFLHQATLSLKSRSGRQLPAGSLTHDTVVPVSIAADGSFELRPDLFGQVVVRTIAGDFASFAGVGSAAPPLRRVVSIVYPSTGPEVPPIKLSTRSD
jgi:hypothetical protein